MIWYACHNDISVLPIGSTYSLMCHNCCKHTKGTVRLTDGFAGFEAGFDTDCCKTCGKIMSQVKHGE